MSKQTDFIARTFPGAQEAMRKYGVPASLTIAQGALETGWGAHAPGNNLFGIKASGWKGKTQILSTKEVTRGKTIKIKALFRAYNSWADSIADYASFIAQNSRYKNVIGISDYKTVCSRIKDDGYATDPNYAKQLIAIIEQYKLYQYDTLPSKLCIDFPVQDKTYSGNIKVCGWGLVTNGIERVDIYYDGKRGIKSIRSFSERKDVLKTANPFAWYKNTGKCGFNTVIPQGKIPKGRHSIDIALIGNDKSVTWATRMISVK